MEKGVQVGSWESDRAEEEAQVGHLFLKPVFLYPMESRKD